MKRRQRDQIVFDLVDGEHEISAADDGRGGQEDPPRPGGGAVRGGLGPAAVAGMVRARGWVSRHRAVSLVATGVAAAVVLGAAGVGTVRERARVDLLRTAPGGVESLAEPPVEAWRYVPDGATNLVGRYGFGTESVTMDGNVVFLEGEQSEVNRSGLDAPDARVRWSDADLVAVDARSGEEAWRVPLGVDPECTPPEAGGTTRAMDEIVCLVGRADERAVVAVTADGEASEARRLAPGDVVPDEVVPVWDGLVVRARSLAGAVPEIDCEDAVAAPQECTVLGGLPDGPSITVRAEDARTGDEVWRETVPWNGDLSACVQGFDAANPPASGADVLGMSVWGSVVQVWGCGVSASFRADGTQLPPDTVPSDGGTGDLLLEQRYDAGTDDLRTTVRTADGDVLVKADGAVLEGRVTDGTPPDTLVIAPGERPVMRAYRHDGSLAWESDPVDGELVARVGTTGVFSRSTVSSVGIDLRTGRQLWEWEGDFDGFAGMQAADPAFTDGTSLMLLRTATPGGASVLAEDGRVVSLDAGEVHLVAVDLTTGRTRWHVEHEDRNWFAADGRLLSVAPDGSLVGHHG
ncbi:PQQ-binding-like beta-propeller repeat protein [Myceligenerans xiligouense]|uniref:Putative pyrroloquinoline-quinone binding quinoprotein n=1 Tax=Myceligenerans xiligouense TaxID=253184 RepID=A0A3N4YXA9_9MICO|nr:PQQ-binding-like beta-propeller repeat protein [Myceligenerans xiligouense]RPF23310.1 putative pyrroloquinoline-quinone binding quinoprotein [Myceligenerans xiligouense]